MLGDFGLVKTDRLAGGAISKGVGTELYMAPEICEEYNEKIDVFR